MVSSKQRALTRLRGKVFGVQLYYYTSTTSRSAKLRKLHSCIASPWGMGLLHTMPALCVPRLPKSSTFLDVCMHD